jgi:hypothetical protein
MTDLAQTQRRLINRPLDEIKHIAGQRGRALVSEAFPSFPLEYPEPASRYADNPANRQAGYVDGERAVWIAATTALLPLQLTFAWRPEMIIADTVRQLKAALIKEGEA